VGLNIFVVNDFAHVNGGTAQVALSSAVGLAERGHSVTLFAAVPPVGVELARSNLRTVLTHQPEIAHDPSRWNAATQGIWNVKARNMMSDAVAECDPENTIVHLHGWSKALSSSVVRECIVRRLKVVCTLHDYFMACPNGGFYNFQRKQICKLRPLSMPCVLEHCDARSFAQKQWRVARQVVQHRWGLMPQGINAFVAVSDFSAEIMRPYLPAGAPVFRIDNPIVVDRAPSAIIEASSPFLYIGRLSPEKGGPMLASAAATLNFPVVFVGEGAMAAEIRASNSSATVTGWLPRAGVLDWLGKARCMVLPSLWYETQGLVVAEAAAAGIPAIVPDTSAARDLVQDGVTGLWFKGGDIVSLKHAMKAMLDTGMARTMGRNAYERFWQNPPTLERHVKGLLECYSSTLSAACG
jgi:glycosyltransferase involved in cell wall biosynthesis